MRPALGKAAGIKGDHAIRFPQLSDHLSDQHRDQRPMIPGRYADKLLQDQALDIDEGGDLLSILAWQVGQQPLEVQVDITLTGFGFQSVLIGHYELAQTIHHVVEDIGGNDAVTQ
jgi:hypothetical protein